MVGERPCQAGLMLTGLQSHQTDVVVVDEVGTAEVRLRPVRQVQLHVLGRNAMDSDQWSEELPATQDDRGRGR